MAWLKENTPSPALPLFSCCVILLASVLGAVPVLGSSPSWTSQEIPSDDVLEARGAVFGQIRILTGDVFDPEKPGENNKIYRIANRLHRTTRPGVVSLHLLFQEGEPFSRQVLEESERILRDSDYFYDAEIRLVAYRNNRIDIEVRTRDVWTFQPGISIGRSGGANSTDFKLKDSNLFGTGKSVAIKHSSDVDRDTLDVNYDDRHFLNSWNRLKLQFSDSTDGGVRRFELARPFYSLDSRRAMGVRFYDRDRADSLYADGELVDYFQHRETIFEVHGGLSRGLREGRNRRWTAGLTYEEHRYGSATHVPTKPYEGDPFGDLLPSKPGPVGDPPPGGPKNEEVDPDEVVASGIWPGDRMLTYPWVGYETRSNKFEKAHSLDQMGRTEDLELGYRFKARFGYASRAFGGDREAAIFDAKFSIGLRPTGRQILLVEAKTSGRWGEAGGEDVRIGGAARFYWRNFGRHLFYARFEAAAVDNLDRDSQLLLGGDSGLRGYPLRYQDGEQRALLSLEQRFFTNFYPFKLFYVGGAVFLDVGQTWGDGLAQDLGLLRNAGLGLRLSSSRSGEGSVIHLDMAFPLDGDDSIKSMQWLVSTKKTF